MDKLTFRNLYSPELFRIGCSIEKNEVPMFSEYISREYFKGVITWNDCTFFTEVIQFESPVMKILYIEGDRDNLDLLRKQILRIRKRRFVPLFLRTLIIYLYFPVSALLGTFSFSCLITKHFGWFGIMFIVIFIVRLIYENGRRFIN